MSNKRPRITVPYQSLDIIVELISITILLLKFGYITYEYSSLPDTIPTHFNASGEADAFGSKQSIWISPVIATILFIAMFILNKYPHIHNYMETITEENAFRNYKFSTRLIRFVSLFLVITFALITFHTIQTAKSDGVTLNKWLLPIIIGMSIAVVPVILIYYYKHIKKS